MSLLTIFTPAYNRAHTIVRTYQSLCRQTSHDFEWLIIDDGSSDNTQDLVRSWLIDSSIRGSDIEFTGFSKDAPWLYIRYIYQNNQGMHGAHNTAYENIKTELNTCIDSDDYAPDDSVAKIAKFWNSQTIENRLKYAGIIALDVNDVNKGVIGDIFPSDLKSTTLLGYYANGGRGDKKLIYRTDVIKSTSLYPLFEGERYVGLNYKYMLVDQQYELLVLNEPVCVVEYQLDGSSSNMYKQYWNNPKGWAFHRKEEMKLTKVFRRKLQLCIHYVSSSIISGNRCFIKESPCKMLTILSIPFGYLLYLKVRYKVKNQVLMKIG